jgi:hypothetical protein
MKIKIAVPEITLNTQQFSWYTQFDLFGCIEWLMSYYNQAGK